MNKRKFKDHRIKRMEELPNELVGEILQRTEMGDKLNARVVCRRWKEIVEGMTKPIRTASEFIKACREGDTLSITCSPHSDDVLVWRRGLKKACRGGHTGLVAKLANKIKGFNKIEIRIILLDVSFRCLEIAREEGHRDVMEELMNQFQYDPSLITLVAFNWGVDIKQACADGDAEKVKRMATMQDLFDFEPLELDELRMELMEIAVEERHLEVIEALLEGFDYDDSSILFVKLSLEADGPRNVEVYEFIELNEWDKEIWRNS